VHSQPLYGGSEHFLRSILPEFNVTPVGFTAGHPISEVEESIRSRTAGGRVSAVLIETPANPTNALVDIGEVVELARSLNGSDDGPVVMVDNTFLGPCGSIPSSTGPISCSTPPRSSSGGTATSSPVRVLDGRT
jgi:methionine-gamma-lyase